MVARGARPCFVSSCKINHFGKKPVRGGSPPREKSRRGESAVRAGALAHELASILILVVLVNLNVKKAEIVITQ